MIPRHHKRNIAIICFVLALICAAIGFCGCASPTAPSERVAQVRWNLVGAGNAFTASIGLPCGTQTDTPITMGPAYRNEPIDAHTILTQWHTVQGRDVAAVFTLTGQDYGICAWVYAS